MAETKLDIINSAFIYCEDEIVSGIDLNIPRLNKAKIVYERGRRDLLSACDWGFARVYIKPTQIDLGDNAPANFKYFYDIPAKCLVKQETFLGDCTALTQYTPDYLKQYGYQTVSLEEIYIPALDKNVWACNHDDISVCCTWDIENTALFKNGFATALAYYIASEICGNINGKTDLRQSLKQEATTRTEAAKLISKNSGGPQKVIDNNGYVAARRRIR